jgi:hypothetical protein
MRLACALHRHLVRLTENAIDVVGVVYTTETACIAFQAPKHICRVCWNENVDMNGDGEG